MAAVLAVAAKPCRKAQHCLLRWIETAGIFNAWELSFNRHDRYDQTNKTTAFWDLLIITFRNTTENCERQFQAKISASGQFFR